MSTKPHMKWRVLFAIILCIFLLCYLLEYWRWTKISKWNDFASFGFFFFFLEKEKFWILIKKIINLGSNMKPRCKLASLLFIYYLYISPLTKLRITYSLSYQFFYCIKNKTQFTIETISQEGTYFTLNILFFFYDYVYKSNFLKEHHLMHSFF